MRLIANPKAGGGRIGRELAQITDQLRSVFPTLDVVCTGAIGGGMELATQAVDEGHSQVLSLGGDGTHSEVAAGLAHTGQANLHLGILHGGTGGDFSRLLGRGTLLEQAQRLAGRPAQPIDLLQVDWTGPNGSPQQRVVLNEVSMGLSGEICTRVNRSSKRLGGGPTFLIHTLRALGSFKAQPVEIDLDGTTIRPGPITTVLVCNGQYAGGGMHFAPPARLSDGALDVVIIKEASPLASVRSLPKLYNGRIAAAPHTELHRGSRVTLRSLGRPLTVEADGEVLDTSPIAVSLREKALWLMGAPPEAL